MKYISQLKLKEFAGKICLLRVDLNIEPNERIKNHLRLKSIIPTINLLIKNNIKVVILSHRGRPQKIDKKLSLKPFSLIISNELKEKVEFFPTFQFRKNKEKIIKSKNRVFLFENLRFLKGEEKNDEKLAKQLAELGDFYVNDAFAVSHRKNSSIVAITKYLPAYFGLLMEKEIKNLNRVIKYYHHPFVIIIGGAKISDKIGVIKNFWHKADYFIFGGGPANTFLAANGVPIGESLIDKSQILNLKSIKNLFKQKIVLPVDVKIKNKKILDIGEKTVKTYSAIIKDSKTVIWNGPMGFFEKKGFEKGTLGIWKAILKNKKAYIVVGGGETIASLKLLKNSRVPGNVFLSTGGSAMLEYLSGKKLPGINV